MEYTVDSIFSIPIFITNIGKIDDSVIDFIDQFDFNYNYEKNEDVVIERGSRFVSNTENLLFYKELQHLKNQINKACSLFMYKELDYTFETDFKISNSWAVKIPQGNCAGIHFHSNSLYSGVVYLRVTEEDSITFFRNLNNEIFNEHPILLYHLETNKTNNNKFNSDNWTFFPNEGDVFLFPSNVPHRVNENVSPSLRYSLAFNIVPTNKINSNPARVIHYMENTETIKAFQ